MTTCVPHYGQINAKKTLLTEYLLLIICDVIKQNQSEVGNIDFEI